MNVKFTLYLIYNISQFEVGNIRNIQFERELKARQQTVSVPEERRNTIIWQVKELLDAPHWVLRPRLSITFVYFLSFCSTMLISQVSLVHKAFLTHY